MAVVSGTLVWTCIGCGAQHESVCTAVGEFPRLQSPSVEEAARAERVRLYRGGASHEGEGAMSESLDRVRKAYEELATAIEKKDVAPDATELAAVALMLDQFGLRGLAFRYAEFAAQASQNQN